MQLLEDISAEQKQARIKNMVEFRTLMFAVRAQGGKLSAAKDRKRFAELKAELDLTDAQVQELYLSLERRARFADDMATQTKLEAEAKALAPRIEAWSKKYEQVRAELDAEGAPILAQMAELQRRIQSLAMKYVGNESEENRHREFYTAGEMDAQKTSPPAPPKFEISVADGSTLSSLLASLRDARCHRAQLDDHGNDLIEMHINNGMPREQLPAAERDDPRMPKARKLADLLRRDKKRWSDREIVQVRGANPRSIPTVKELSPSEKALIETALKFGWIRQEDIEPAAEGAFGKPVEASR